MSELHQLFEARPDGPVRIPCPGYENAHDLLDELPLGVYEALRTFDHVRFIGLKEHLDRAQLSMQRCGWSERLERELICRSLDQLVADYPAADARVRFDILEDTAPDKGVHSRIVIALSPFQELPQEVTTQGVRVLLTRKLRRSKPLVKRAEFILERRPYPLHEPDAFEHIMVDEEDRLLEGTSSNFFHVQGGSLRTSGARVLEGVTRAFVRKLAHEAGIEFLEESTTVDQIKALDEAFITSSMKGIVPVRMIDDTPIGTACPGPLTRQLLDSYGRYVSQHATRASESC